MARGINTINGVDYVYEYKSQWNAKLHRSEQKRDYIGKMKDGKFVPNKFYRMRVELEALKRQNGLPSDGNDMPLEDEIEDIYRKHVEHKAKLAEMKENPKPKKSAVKAKAKAKTENKAVAEKPTAKKAEAEDAEEKMENIEIGASVSAEPCAEASSSVETVAVTEEAVKPADEEVVQKAEDTGRHVLREGELDDEEYGPDLFNVQPSVAPFEEKAEEEVIEEEEEEDEDPDLFAFADVIEKWGIEEETPAESETAEEELAVEAETVEETAVEVEPDVEVEPEPSVEEQVLDAEVTSEEEPERKELVEKEIPEVGKEPDKKAKTTKTRKEKKEEDNGQLFLF